MRNRKSWLERFAEWLSSWWDMPGRNPLPWMIVDTEKGVPIRDSGDVEAIASLRDHPGMKALLNRMRLQRAVLTAALTSKRHKDIRDVDCLQLGHYWLGFLESQITEAIGKAQAKPTPVVAADSLIEFERIRSAIESVGTTSPEE